VKKWLSRSVIELYRISCA